MSKKQVYRFHKYIRVSILFLIISSLLAAGIFYTNINNLLAKPGEQVVYSNEFYTLKGNPTELQKTLFKELTTEIEQKTDYDLEVGSSIVKNFIADFFNWTNKTGPYDIGGKQYIMSLEGTNFYSTMRRYFNSDIERYLAKGFDMKELIEVESIEVVVVDYAASYIYYEKEYKSIYVYAEWTYKENENIDISVFKHSGEFTVIINEEGRYEIARFY